MTERPYSDLTIDITDQLSKAEKKEYGFFVTPPSIIDPLLERVQHFINERPIENILEPSCGSCEFVTAVAKLFPTATIDAIELNPTVFRNIQQKTFGAPKQVQLYNTDFMTWDKPSTYDVIIGNPPYFVCPKQQIPFRYHSLMIGRPNMFGAFIIHALSQLKEGGILSFVIPKSFMNAGFYSRIRDYIINTCTILEVIDFETSNDFLETQQSTIGLILQKGNPQPTSPYIFKIGNENILTENAGKLHILFEGATTLKALNYSVKTGSVVWNQHKDKLTHNSSKTMLLYNSNIGSNGLVEEKTFSNDEKKQFIDLVGFNEPCIVVNRGNGNTSYNLTCALVDGKRPYLVENHLNRIVFLGKTSPEYNRILSSFRDPRTYEFIRLFIGNGGLSKTELESILPIYF